MTLKFAKISDVSASPELAYAMVTGVTENPSDGPQCPPETQVGYRWDGGSFFPFDFDAEISAIQTQAKKLVAKEFSINLENLLFNAPERVEQVWGMERDWAWSVLTDDEFANINAKHLLKTAKPLAEATWTKEQLGMKVMVADATFRHTASIAVFHRRRVEELIDNATTYTEILGIIQAERDNAAVTFASIASDIETFKTTAPTLITEAITRATGP
ncbi:hypothetical protein [Litorimonas sp.]|uniref:hypothetical protein n=1 Tax=Litorimonas sp. TaxID=1892381 RepID=UPI003A86E927